MTDEEVLAFLAAHGVSGFPFPVRAEPSDGQDHPGDRVFWYPVLLDDGRYLAIAWQFGQPDPDEAANWKVRWHAVHGPVTREELEELARA
jgi:hypothetical protein